MFNTLARTAIDLVNPLSQIGFPLVLESRFPTNFKLSAKHVQCIHCSVGFGSPVHDQCHEDWVMGNCGISQACSTDPPYGSHGQCPYIYVYAMTEDFYSVAVPASGACLLENNLNTAEYGVAKMGYYSVPPNPR